MLRSPLFIFPFLLALAVLLAAGGRVALAQAQQERIDLSVEVDGSDYRHHTSRGNWVITARNHGTDKAYGVTVRIELPEQEYSEPSQVWEVIGNNPVTLLWRVGNLEGGGSRTQSLATKLAPGVEAVGNFPTVLAVRGRAVISSDAPAEPERLLYNNAHEGWIAGHSGGVRGRASVGGNVHPQVSLNNWLPQDGETVVLDFRLGGGCPSRAQCRGYGYRLRVQLPTGLGTPTAELDTGTSTSTFTRAPVQGNQWDWVTELVSRANISISLSVPVTDSAALVGECVTAELTVERPADDPSDNLVRICFQEAPITLLRTGETDLFTLYPCVGVSAYPCTSADTLEVVAIGGSAGTNAGLSSSEAVIQPGRVFVHIPDRHGRVGLPLSNDIEWRTAGSRDVSAGVQVRENIDRIATPLTGGGNQLSTDWTAYADRIRATGIGGGEKPGYLKIRDTGGTITYASADPPTPSEMGAPSYYEVDSEGYYKFPLDFGGNAGVQTGPLVLHFGALGTYITERNYKATHNGIRHTATGVYTFHVGPIAELEVGDGGAVPDLAADQYAIRVLASNDGPDIAPDAEVTIDLTLPEGVTVARHLAGSGTYHNGVWDIGRLREKGYYRAAGRRLEGEQLVLILQGENAANATATASIANVEDYEKCIYFDAQDLPLRPPIDVSVTGADAAAREAACLTVSGASWHTTHYFDYIDDNNTATIMALPGAGGTPPGTPQDLQGSFFLQPPTAVVRWAEVESLNGWAVSHYQVWKFEDEPGAVCQAPRVDQDGAKIEGTTHLDSRYVEDSRTCYYVRAVNIQGVPGYWSEPVTATSKGLDQPRLSLEAGPDVGEGEDVTFTVRASPAPVAGDTLVVYYTVADKRVDIETGGYVEATEEGRQDIPLDNRGRATITVPTQSDDMDRPDGEVTVTLEDGFGYTLGTPKTASVAVLDDDNPTVSFAASPTEPLSEGNYTHNVTVNLDRPSHAALDIHYTLGGDVGDENVRFAISGSGRERFVTAPSGVTSVDIPVRLLDDNQSRGDTVLNLFLSPRHYYDLGSPASYTLTIIEDDGPRAEFALTESEVDEANVTHNVVVNLNPAPTGPVTINYSFGGTATSGDDYSIAGTTGLTGSLSADAGDPSVTIPLTIMADPDIEGDETVALTLLHSPGYTLGNDRRHEVTIRDDDLPRASFDAGTSNPGEGKGTHNVRVNLNPPAPPDGLILRYGVGGDATRNRDYRVDSTVEAQGGANHVNIPVEITDDGDSEPDETVVLTLRAGTDYAVDDPGEHTLTIADDDPPLVAFAAAEASASERGGTHRATILVVPAPHTDITVEYTVGGTATRGAEDDFTISDCDGDPCTVTVRRGQGRVDVPVLIDNDDDNEGDETVVLTLTGGDGYDLALPVRHELTIRDDDAPVVSFPEPAESVYEDNIGTHTVRVNLDRPAERAFTLVFNVGNTPSGDLGADGATDYSLPDPMEAQVIAGRDYVDIPVTITADTDNEADEIVVLTLEPGRGYSVGSADEYTLTIVDDDHDENTPVASLNNPNFHGTGATQLEWWEDGGAARPTWHVTGNFTGDVIFQYVGGTATLHEDFTVERIQGQTIEKAGDVFTVRSLESPQDFDRDTGVRWARFIFIPIRDDRAEGRETAIFRVLNGPGYTVGEPTELTIIIKD